MSYCGSIYTAFDWCDSTKRQYRQLKVAYSNLFKRFWNFIVPAAWVFFLLNTTDGFDAFAQKLVNGFRERLQNSGNTFIENALLSIVPHGIFQCCRNCGKNIHICHKSWFLMHWCCDKCDAMFIYLLWLLSYVIIIIFCMCMIYLNYIMHVQLLIMGEMLKMWM